MQHLKLVPAGCYVLLIKNKIEINKGRLKDKKKESTLNNKYKY